jgi:phospholipase/carboxylesterase
MTKQLSNLEKIILNPNGDPKYSIIWLHGLGASGDDFVPIVPALNLPFANEVRYIFPHAPDMPVTLNKGYIMPAWFDIYGLDKDSKEDYQGIETARLLINQLIEDEHATGIPYTNIVLVGFSQGGALALYTGLKYSNKLAGIIGLSCYLPFTDQNYSAANQTTPILLAHGNNDSVVSESYGQSTYARLNKLGYNVDWRSYPMGHQVCDQEIQDIAVFLQSVYC